MTDTLTDERVICEWMGWQVGPIPYTPDLDALRKVEERLTQAGVGSSSDPKDHPFMMYMAALHKILGLRDWEYCDKAWGYHGNLHDLFPLVHASAEQKIRALGAVLRAEGKHE